MKPEPPPVGSVSIPPEIQAVIDPACPGCRAQSAYFQAQLAALTERIATLEARLSQNSSNSSRPPSSDAPRSPKRKPPATPSGRKRGGQPGHHGVTRAFKPLEVMAEVVEQVPTHCGHCCAPLPSGSSETDPAPMRHQVTELPPVVCFTTEYRLHARTCPDCRRRTWASLPKGVPHGVVGPRLQAVCSLLTGAYRLSRRSTQELVRDLFGEELALGTLASLEARTAQALASPYDETAGAVAVAPQVNVDETRWREGKGAAWLWLAATPTLALFRVDISRSRAAFAALLPAPAADQQRTVTSDRYSAYSHLVGEAHQLCWSHLARDFQGWVDAGGKARPFGERALLATRQVFHLWHQYRDGSLDQSELQAQIEPVQVALQRVLKEASASGNWKVAGPAWHLLGHWESLWTFTRREGVEPTNNHAERALRRGVLWRKNSFGHQSESGRAFVERLLTVVVSLRLQGRSVLEYLDAVCRAALLRHPAPSLLPHTAG